jgi:predicted glycogen debranching enzyme
VSEADIVMPWHAGDDPAELRDREWLVTNGLGGYASGTALGIGTRQHHGLFVPNLTNPKGRHVMISRFDEEIECSGVRAQIGGAEFTDGRLESETHLYLHEFRVSHLMPTWTFRIGDALIEKTVVMPHNQNTVCVHYRMLEGASAQVMLRMFVAFRRIDAALAHRSNWPFRLVIAQGRHEIEAPELQLRVRFGLRPARGVFVSEERESQNALYRVERDRGYDHSENLWSPGYFKVELRKDAPVTFMATTQGWEVFESDGAEALLSAKSRADRLVALAPAAARHGFAAQLVMAADQFIVLPGSRLEEKMLAEAAGEVLRTVIAGYHWFGDWGRDTMISLDGLTLCTGRLREAGAILRTFSHYVKDGLLPNLFPEGEREALYHTVDATLWYFHAIDRYRLVTGDIEIVSELFPVLESIIEHYARGTRFGIGVDEHDGLVSASAPGYQLTWMDAKVGDWVVTPRRGKPVEIQALWYNALRLMAEWSALVGKPSEVYDKRASRAQAAFNARFFRPELGHLLDVVDGEGGDDASCRPNQLFTLSLHHPILDRRHWQPVVDCVQRELLTPLGLRTLSAKHPDYKANYEGDLRTRDAAYHQGTVWPWLTGHFIDAWLRVYADKRKARQMLHGFADHLHAAGVGSISEIFDAEPPFKPRGCIAQAWSVGEVLRAWLTTEAE